MLRKARPVDRKLIVDLAKSTKVFTPEEIECLDQDLNDYFLTENEDTVVVCEEEKNILGFFQIGPLPITDKSYMLHWIAVGKKSQKAGVGRKLIERAEKIAQEENARIIFIETSSSDKFATPRKFYMRNGFLPVSVVTDYYGLFDHKVIFSKLLMEISIRTVD